MKLYIFITLLIAILVTISISTPITTSQFQHSTPQQPHPETQSSTTTFSPSATDPAPFVVSYEPFSKHSPSLQIKLSNMNEIFLTKKELILNSFDLPIPLAPYNNGNQYSSKILTVVNFKPSHQAAPTKIAVPYVPTHNAETMRATLPATEIALPHMQQTDWDNFESLEIFIVLDTESFDFDKYEFDLSITLKDTATKITQQLVIIPSASILREFGVKHQSTNDPTFHHFEIELSLFDPNDDRIIPVATEITYDLVFGANPPGSKSAFQPGTFVKVDATKVDPICEIQILGDDSSKQTVKTTSSNTSDILQESITLKVSQLGTKILTHTHYHITCPDWYLLGDNTWTSLPYHWTVSPSTNPAFIPSNSISTTAPVGSSVVTPIRATPDHSFKVSYQPYHAEVPELIIEISDLKSLFTPGPDEQGQTRQKFKLDRFMLPLNVVDVKAKHRCAVIVTIKDADTGVIHEKISQTFFDLVAYEFYGKVNSRTVDLDIYHPSDPTHIDVKIRLFFTTPATETTPAKLPHYITIPPFFFQYDKSQGGSRFVYYESSTTMIASNAMFSNPKVTFLPRPAPFDQISTTSSFQLDFHVVEVNDELFYEDQKLVFALIQSEGRIEKGPFVLDMVAPDSPLHKTCSISKKGAPAEEEVVFGIDVSDDKYSMTLKFSEILTKSPFFFTRSQDYIIKCNSIWIIVDKTSTNRANAYFKRSLWSLFPKDSEMLDPTKQGSLVTVFPAPSLQSLEYPINKVDLEIEYTPYSPQNPEITVYVKSLLEFAPQCVKGLSVLPFSVDGFNIINTYPNNKVSARFRSSDGSSGSSNEWFDTRTMTNYDGVEKKWVDEVKFKDLMLSSKLTSFSLTFTFLVDKPSDEIRFNFGLRCDGSSQTMYYGTTSQLVMKKSKQIFSNFQLKYLFPQDDTTFTTKNRRFEFEFQVSDAIAVITAPVRFHIYDPVFAAGPIHSLNAAGTPVTCQGHTPDGKIISMGAEIMDTSSTIQINFDRQGFQPSSRGVYRITDCTAYLVPQNDYQFNNGLNWIINPALQPFFVDPHKSDTFYQTSILADPMKNTKPPTPPDPIDVDWDFKITKHSPISQYSSTIAILLASVPSANPNAQTFNMDVRFPEQMIVSRNLEQKIQLISTCQDFDTAYFLPDIIRETTFYLSTDDELKNKFTISDVTFDACAGQGGGRILKKTHSAVLFLQVDVVKQSPLKIAIDAVDVHTKDSYSSAEMTELVWNSSIIDDKDGSIKMTNEKATKAHPIPRAKLPFYATFTPIDINKVNVELSTQSIVLSSSASQGITTSVFEHFLDKSITPECDLGANGKLTPIIDQYGHTMTFDLTKLTKPIVIGENVSINCPDWFLHLSEKTRVIPLSWQLMTTNAINEELNVQNENQNQLSHVSSALTTWLQPAIYTGPPVSPDDDDDGGDDQGGGDKSKPKSQVAKIIIIVVLVFVVIVLLIVATILFLKRRRDKQNEERIKVQKLSPLNSAYADFDDRLQKPANVDKPKQWPISSWDHGDTTDTEL